MPLVRCLKLLIPTLIKKKGNFYILHDHISPFDDVNDMQLNLA